jgi:hypothetical protein
LGVAGGAELGDLGPVGAGDGDDDEVVAAALDVDRLSSGQVSEAADFDPVPAGVEFGVAQWAHHLTV